jgi:hypothetical protein
MQTEQPEIDSVPLPGRISGDGRGAHLMHQAGRTLAVTEIDPLPPAASGDGRRVIAAVHAEANRDALQQIGAAFDVAGRILDADDTRHLRQAQVVSLPRSATVRPGTLYRIIGSSTASAMALKCGTGLPVSACCNRAPPTGGHRRPLRAKLASSMASRVELAPVPAITGMRPATRRTAVSISAQCSSTSTVGDSPVVPTTTTRVRALAMCQSSRRSKPGRSSEPSSCIGREDRRNGTLYGLHENFRN